MIPNKKPPAIVTPFATFSLRLAVGVPEAKRKCILSLKQQSPKNLCKDEVDKILDDKRLFANIAIDTAGLR